MARIEENEETFLKIYNQIGENFKKKRKMKGWSQKQLCQETKKKYPNLSITQSDISELEHKRKPENTLVHPRTYKLLCLASTLEMHPSEIYSIKGEKEPFSSELYQNLTSEEKFKNRLGMNLDTIMKEKDYSRFLLTDLFFDKTNEFGILISSDSDSIERSIQRYRNGERNPPFYNLILLCNALDVEISYFLS
ncbi:helix-turn-helix domain-containing protein [Blautia hansenii]|uniref:helix-turn-helix domain-containing protein n=1 Tax=Blautia hansenii TaxID=1322 RepID=UPI0022DF6020|nr:helix-turn-helix transcriptional regulator [Blautia hansenii]